jgi:hypothetical protein
MTESLIVNIYAITINFKRDMVTSFKSRNVNRYYKIKITWRFNTINDAMPLCRPANPRSSHRSCVTRPIYLKQQFQTRFYSCSCEGGCWKISVGNCLHSWRGHTHTDNTVSGAQLLVCEKERANLPPPVWFARACFGMRGAPYLASLNFSSIFPYSNRRRCCDFV